MVTSRDDSRRSAPPLLRTVFVFGALLGTVGGICVVAPALIAAHRIVPATALQWLLLDVALVVFSAVIGITLALFVSSILLGWPLLRRRSYRRPAWVMALGLTVALPVAYLVAAAVVHWKYVGRVRPPGGAELLFALAAYVTLVVSVVRLYRHVASAARPPQLRTVTRALAATTVVGILLLPVRAPSVAVRDSDEISFGPAAKGASSRVLLVGIDSGNWDTIVPLVARGALPTIGRLLETGMHGDLHALWPPYWSAPAWAAILTGHPRDEVDVYSDLTLHAPGLPPFDAPFEASFALAPYFLLEWNLIGVDAMRATHPPRDVLRRRPIWELLEAAGVRSGVVRFDFTYPAANQASVIVSNRVGHDTWSVARVSVGKGPGLVAPAALGTEVLPLFDEQTPFDEGSFAGVLSDSAGAARRLPFEVEMLRAGFDIDQRTARAARHVLQRRKDLRFMGVYLGGFDNVCHAFWPYRFPEAYGTDAPPPADVATFGPVVDAYLRFLDAEIAALIATYDRPPDVIIVSDHGHQRNFDMPLWGGWHGPTAIFIAAGPGIPRRPEGMQVSYYDVVPTIAEVLGLGVPPRMHGRSVLRD